MRYLISWGYPKPMLQFEKAVRTDERERMRVDAAMAADRWPTVALLIVKAIDASHDGPEVDRLAKLSGASVEFRGGWRSPFGAIPTPG